MRWLLLAALLFGCTSGPGDTDCDTGCTGTSGSCLQCPTAYSCNSGGTCGSLTDGIACCDGTSNGQSGCCGAWSCNGNAQCAATSGAPTGSLCGFADLATCNTWCSTYFPGNCTCAC